MKKTLFTFGTVTLLASTSTFADVTKSQIRVQESAQYKEDVQYKYRYHPEEAKKYKGEHKPNYQYRYQYRNHMNDSMGRGMGSMRSMGGAKGTASRH